MNDGWADSRSFIRCDEINGKKRFQGKYWTGEICFRFSGSDGNTGPYSIRGTISALAPYSNRVLSFDKKDSSDDNCQQKKQFVQKALLSNNFDTKHPNHSTAEIIKGIIAKDAEHLYADNLEVILRSQKQYQTTPSMITPAVAGYAFVDDFLTVNYSSLKDSVRARYRKMILSGCTRFRLFGDTYRPMKDYKSIEISRAIRDVPFSAQQANLLHEFWVYCIDSGKSDGDDPWPAKKKHRLSEKTLQARARRPDRLGEEEQMRLSSIMLERHDGLMCGISLILFGGLSSESAVAMTWEDITWHDTLKDFAVMKINKPDLSGATHDFSRPMFPAGARILRARFEEVKEKYPKKYLAIPIAGMISEESKAYSSSTLLSNASSLLKDIIGVQAFQDVTIGLEPINGRKPSTAGSILINTYKHNVSVGCNLLDDPGTQNFLMGNRLRGTSDDSYISYTCPEARERLYSLLSRVTPFPKISSKSFSEAQSDGTQRYSIAPHDATSGAGFITEIILMPGESISLQAKHGMKGTISARAINEDGTPKRKSKQNHKTHNTKAPSFADDKSEPSNADISKPEKTAETGAIDDSPQIQTSSKLDGQKNEAEFAKTCSEEIDTYEQLSMFAL